jgi:hypothetical protein
MLAGMRFSGDVGSAEAVAEHGDQVFAAVRMDLHRVGAGDHRFEGAGLEVATDAAGTLGSAEEGCERAAEGADRLGDRGRDIEPSGGEPMGQGVARGASRDHPHDEVAERGSWVRCPAERDGFGDEGGHPVDDRRVDEGGFGREVPVDGAGSDACASGDLVEGDVDAIAVERLRGRRKDACTVRNCVDP